ncbi:MAG: phosphatase family protein [Micrococcaceae bacterium]|nr:phosphatase family protein [Micrococcaceae bacterium]
MTTSSRQPSLRGSSASSRPNRQVSGQRVFRDSFLLRHWVLSPLLIALIYGAGLVLKTNVFLAASDPHLLHDVGTHHTDAGNVIALTIHMGLGGLSAVVVLVIAAVAVMALKRSIADGLIVLIMTTGGWAATAVMKVMVGRDRPDQNVLTDPLLPDVQGATSYPSGHTAFAVSLGIAVSLVMLRTRWKVPVVIGAVVFAVIVGASRIYLGVHYLSDVVASFALSVAVAVLLSGAIASLQLTPGERGR